MANIKVCDICGRKLKRHLLFTGYQPVVPRYEIREIGHLNKSKVLDLCAVCHLRYDAKHHAETRRRKKHGIHGNV